ncbi:MAG TPA: family 16 glycoside hydrolase [Chitinophagaceae bacterium]|nr:family 16 glycoside hydrolase [Chitinophagaceae bacterium]
MKHTLLCLPLSLLILASCKHQGATQNPASTASTVPTIPYRHLDLTDTADFVYSSPDHNNWSIAGKVFSDRNTVHSLEPSVGTGVLLSKPTDADKAELLTKFQQGDMDLELDFMMPKGSNSGIYFMGRYEVQLFDSWLKPADSLRYGDCGGIYERMAGGHGYEGTAPALNACKAPGLWQHLKVRFRAPRFDASGKKVANACFMWVYLNGALVQQNVRPTLPTLGSFYSDEKPTGPLEIQGSHGPVAFRNIRYRTYINGRIQLKDMELKVYKSLLANINTLKGLTPDRILHPDSLSQLSYNKFEQGMYHGTVVVPDSGEYIFKLQAGGPAWLWIDSALIVSNHGSGDYFTPWYKTVHLSKGSHRFSLAYNNRYQQFKLTYQATHIPVTALTTPSSAFPEPALQPYIIAVGRRAEVQRGFLMHHGKKMTHAMAVGLPGGINYAYSLATENILSAWRGGFVNTADMWRERGEQQLEQPLGGVTTFDGLPAVQILQDKNGPWPASLRVDSSLFTHRGYRLLEDGSPEFFYTYKNVAIQDQLEADKAEGGLARKLTFSFHSPEKRAGDQGDLYLLAAEGDLIKKLPDGSFAIGDDNYYIAGVKSASPPLIIKNTVKNVDHYRLLIPITAKKDTASIRYNIIW